MTRDESNPYAVLGITPAATVDEITQAFRERLHALHSDGQTTTIRSADTYQTIEGRLTEVLSAYVSIRRFRQTRDGETPEVT